MIVIKDEEIIKIAIDLIKKQDYSEAIEYLNQIPDNGDALYLMAQYIDQIGSRQKQHLVYTDRFELLLYSANKGNCLAMKELADMYKYGGKFFERNEKRMFEWYKKAYDAGNVEALNDLIYCYRAGVGTKQDFEMVLKLKKENNITT